ncbi:MAG TPA: outer membrane protein assembly factor BamA, partial [Candidatus Tenderia electrophaga]|nr:outer membrane protein assembly factor BamA [Candidatus Tenderia electrophaga]
MKRLLLKICLLSVVLWAGVVGAVESFTVSDIRVQGLQRISEGTIFNYMPIEIGDELDDARSGEIISTLYKTGFFKDIELLRDGDALIVKVLERPSIASISITGNSEISSEDLETGMENAGLTKGRILDVSLLDRIELDLQQQYVIRGFYAVEIETEVTPTGENQVDVTINIQEGEVALIRQVNIIGASAFDEDDLLDEFELGIPAFYSIFSSRDQYSKQKLAADIETLKSFYLDRGYINFNVVSTQVSITPEKKSVFITLNIDEGEQFTISSIELAGDLIVPEAELKGLIKVEPGDIFSRRKVNAISSAIGDRLGNEGYAFANVNAIPEIDAEGKQVSLIYFIDPGKRVYVRRINISGNEKTDDEVIRREFRQMEGAWLSTTKLNRSQVRVQRLGYLDQVTLETPLVPGISDQVDVNMSV